MGLFGNKKRKLRGKDHSIHAEPTTAAMSDTLEPRADIHETKVTEKIDNEHLAESFASEAERSVFDEPTFSTDLAGEVPENALTYERYLKEQVESTGVFESWFWTGVMAMGAGFLAILGTFIGSASAGGLEGQFQFFAIAVFGPVVEEVMKTALLLWAVEQRPFLFRSSRQLMIAGALSGLVFASVENALYLKVYIDDPGPYLILWRWTVCVGLHTGTTMIATIGLVKIWRRVMRTGKFARAELGARYLFIAIVIHGSYNAIMLLIGSIGLF